jgi:hypothetical protein
VVGRPRVTNRSFSATGTPASGPGSPPRAISASISPARASAASAATCRKAPMRGSAAAMRSRCAAVTSRAEISFARTRRASADADW